MLSRPTGLEQMGQEGVAGFDNVIRSALISAPALGFRTVAKFPNVFGTVPVSVNTTLELLSPVNTYGMVVMLE